MAWTDEVVLVTGASRGIGRAIALELGHRGAVVVGTATTNEGADKVSSAFASEKLNGRGAVLDVNDVDRQKELFDEIKDEYGAVTILVNNAGVTRDNLLMRMKDDEWDDVVSTNLTAIFKLTRLSLRAMMRARKGRIINVGSVVGATGNPGQANYAAAKAGLVGFSKALAREVASRGITVNVVAPGFIETDMTGELDESQREGLSGQIPLGRLGTPQDIAKAVAYLASEDADYVTGETLHINGGMFMP